MKKKIISILSITMCSVLLLFGCGSKKKDTIIVGTEAGFAPYEYMKGNEIVG